MAVVISLLRGVNLAQHKRLKMDALRAVYTALGLKQPQTYLQSGNVIFQSGESDLAGLAARIEKAIEREFGFHSDVILRTPEELRAVIARNPFAKRRDVEPGKLIVHFLACDPGPEGTEKVLAITAEPEELRLVDRELYIYYPNGMGRSKLSMARIERAAGTTGTARNWNTATNLAALAEAAETAAGKKPAVRRAGAGKGGVGG